MTSQSHLGFESHGRLEVVFIALIYPRFTSLESLLLCKPELRRFLNRNCYLVPKTRRADEIRQMQRRVAMSKSLLYCYVYNTLLCMYELLWLLCCVLLLCSGLPAVGWRDGRVRRAVKGLLMTRTVLNDMNRLPPGNPDRLISAYLKLQLMCSAHVTCRKAFKNLHAEKFTDYCNSPLEERRFNPQTYNRFQRDL